VRGACLFAYGDHELECTKPLRPGGDSLWPGNDGRSNARGIISCTSANKWMFTRAYGVFSCTTFQGALFLVISAAFALGIAHPRSRRLLGLGFDRSSFLARSRGGGAGSCLRPRAFFSAGLPGDFFSLRKCAMLLTPCAAAAGSVF
jgi:hypothetical protein